LVNPGASFLPSKLKTSERIKDLRMLFMKQKLALSKFHKEAGDDWRNSRFIYAISSIQAQAYRLSKEAKLFISIPMGSIFYT
jgi:hypothetical protein